MRPVKHGVISKTEAVASFRKLERNTEILVEPKQQSGVGFNLRWRQHLSAMRHILDAEPMLIIVLLVVPTDRESRVPQTDELR